MCNQLQLGRLDNICLLGKQLQERDCLFEIERMLRFFALAIVIQSGFFWPYFAPFSISSSIVKKAIKSEVMKHASHS